MAYSHYTACYIHVKGDKPYNEKDRLAFVVGQLLKLLVVTGVAAGLGFVLAGGPFGAIVAGAAAYLSSLTDTIEHAADEWLHHRLICLAQGNPKCAVGIVSYDPFRGDLGAFDNDQYIDVVLMPHPVKPASLEIEDGKYIPALLPGNRFGKDGKIVPPFDQFVSDHPENVLPDDGFQASELLAPDPQLEADLGYVGLWSHERTALHCEAEGDFWVKMKDWAPAIAILLTAALAGTAAATGAGYAAGGAVGCAIGVFLFGPIGCAIGGFIGSLFGAAAGAAAGGALSYVTGKAVLQALFDADAGNVEDANVGDHALGPIRMGDHVAVLGEHVYDGYHEGWNEFHPLMAVVKFNAHPGERPPVYMDWQPDTREAVVIPDKVDPASPDLTEAAMRAGLSDVDFRKRCEIVRDEWCRRLHDAFAPETRKTQDRLEHRWTIHPTIDGCAPEPDDLH